MVESPLAAWARACGVTTSAVGLWLRHDSTVSDPGMISAIQIAFADTGVALEHEPDDIDDVGGALLVDGWTVRPTGET